MYDLSDLIVKHEAEFDFMRSSGPGGQNVNKVETAVKLKFNVKASRYLSPEVKERLIKLAGRRAGSEGVIIIDARTSRSQHQNREDAIGRLKELIAAALEKPKMRFKTRPTPSSDFERLNEKSHRGVIKSFRASPRDLEE